MEFLLPSLTALAPSPAHSITACRETPVCSPISTSDTAWTITDTGKTLVADSQHPCQASSLPIR
ncbi:hypothetical protein NS376_20045 [Pseudomonas oryzihabitans]|nr:hypothetical protein NS376_20045 [Pseudomonas psychrotolerans]